MIKRLRPKREDAEEVPVAAFSDIAFLLIIFFILATTLVKPYGMTTELPASDKSPAQQTEKKTNIVQLNEGKITFNDRTLTLDKLQKQLEVLQLNKKTEDADRIVLLESTGAVPYQLYYEVMLSITRAGGVIAIMREEEKQS